MMIRPRYLRKEVDWALDRNSVIGLRLALYFRHLEMLEDKELAERNHGESLVIHNVFEQSIKCRDG